LLAVLGYNAMMTDVKQMGGRVIDITARLAERRTVAPAAERPRLFAAPAPHTRRQGEHVLGERPDGTIDLATWRATWREVFKAEFEMCGESEGSLRFFHDTRSNSLEFFALDEAARGTRHVLSPAEAMRLVVALNAAYGFEPKGPSGSPGSTWDDGRGPSAA
jgi:hypothetical protein